jgi:hypothetical protein
MPAAWAADTLSQHGCCHTLSARTQDSSHNAPSHLLLFWWLQIGTAFRTPSAVGPSQVCISLSRSLAAGLDWREQLTLAQIQQHVAAAGWATRPGARPAPAAASTAATGVRLGSAQPGGHSCSTCSSTGAGQTCPTGGQPVAVPASQQQLPGAEQADPAPSTVLACCADPQQQQQQQQQDHAQSLTHQLCAGAQHDDSSQQQRGSRPQLPPAQQQGRSVLLRRPATTGSSTCSSNSSRPTHAGCLPWQLAAALSQQEQALQALMARQELQQQQGTGCDSMGQSEPGGLHEQPCTTNSPYLDSQQQQQVSAVRPVVVVLQQQEVLQHKSAARAASAVQQLAARRQQWADLSSTCPPPYPVFLQGTPDSPAH